MSETMNFPLGAGEAGVSASITDASPQIAQGQFGATLLLGPFDKGVTGAVHRVRDTRGFRRLLGRVLDDDYSGVAAHAVLGMSRGAGSLHAWRVADSELGALVGQLKLYGRKCLASRLTQGVSTDSAPERKVAQRAYALSPGVWSGGAFEFAGSVDDSNISGATISLGTAFNDYWLENELVGAKFKIASFAREFTILSHTASDDSVGPTLTLDATFEGYEAISAAVLFRLYRENLDDESERREATIRVQDDGTRPGTRWGATVASDGNPVSPRFEDLDLGDQESIGRDVNAAIEIGYGEVGLDADGQDVPDPALPEWRPCNWSGIAQPASVSAAADIGKARVVSGRLYLSVTEFFIDTAAGGRPALASSPTLPSTVIPQVWTLTFTSASAFTATVVDPRTGEEIVKASQLPTGATGAAYPTAASVFDDHPDLASFQIATDATIQAGTVVKLYVWPLPQGLKNRNGRLYGAAWNGTGRSDASTDPGTNTSAPAVTKSYRIIDNGPDWVKLQTGEDLTTALQAPKAPVARGTDTTNEHDTSGTAKTFIYNIVIDGVDKHPSDITLTMTVGSATAPTADVAADLLAKSEAAEGDLFFYADSSNRLCAAVKDGNAGALVELAIKNGTINSEVGLSNATDHAGFDGSVMRIEYDQGLMGARYEAGQVAVADLQDALNSQKLIDWVKAQSGLVTLYMPGVSDPTTVQALIDFCASHGAFCTFDMPNSLADEDAAIAWLQANITPKRVFATHYPSWGETTRSPRTTSGRETIPIGAAILGAEMAWYNDKTEGLGYHKATAGTHLRLAPWITRLVRDATVAPTPADLIQRPQTRQGALNLAGIRPVMDGRAVYLYGDEGPNQQYQGRYWIHKARCSLHILAEVRVNAAPLIYHLNNASQRVALVNLLRTLMRPHYREGWFDPLEDGLPDSFESAVRIQSNVLNNPQAVRDAGHLVAAMQYRVTNTTKVVDVGLRDDGISVAI